MSVLSFRCNVCNRPVTLPAESFHREGGHCPRCGSTVRFRGLMHALANGLFGRPLAIDEFPDGKRLVGLGLSDAPCYAARLAERTTYTNYFYHSTPFLDITRPDPALHGTCDFLVASDVFEHVPPPRHVPFDSVARLLKPGGLLVLSVPYTHLPKTVEYYPDLHDFHVVTLAGDQILVNRTIEGRVQMFDHLFWHGGEGWTLELRVLAEADVLRLLARAGFQDIVIQDGDVEKLGVVHTGQDHSFVITALRGPSGPREVSSAEEASWLYPPGARVDHPQVHHPERIDQRTVVDVIRALDREANATGRLTKELQALYASSSWRLTAPLRRLRTWLTRRW